MTSSECLFQGGTYQGTEVNLGNTVTEIKTQHWYLA